ncbi:Myb transcription factor [Moelleriella libera RCEF 2490]|uniref:Myb transcription factor n=1 Tax=Moelleriella libera RCEF 2490 TaxID=1081109 RepID=A0A168F1C5_9HYPO|nr:Myb transcription factor [Moelleriella libera RCEF 2490]
MDVSNPSRPIPQKRGPWSNGEDNRLIMLVQDHGPLNWVRIAEILGTRTPKQCRERYHQNLKPTLNRGPITNEEGQIIDDLVQTIGKKWAEIARRLNGRSDNAVKNWWNGSQNRQKRRNQSRRQAQEQSTITGREFSRMPVVRESDQPSHPSQTPADTRSPGLNGQSPHATTWHTATLPSPSSSDLTESEVEMNYTTSPASQAHSRESAYTYRPQIIAFAAGSIIRRSAFSEGSIVWRRAFVAGDDTSTRALSTVVVASRSVIYASVLIFFAAFNAIARYEALRSRTADNGGVSHGSGRCQATIAAITSPHGSKLATVQS